MKSQLSALNSQLSTNLHPRPGQNGLGASDGVVASGAARRSSPSPLRSVWSPGFSRRNLTPCHGIKTMPTAPTPHTLPAKAGTPNLQGERAGVRVSATAWLTLFVLTLVTCAHATVTNIAWYRLGENDPGAASGQV